MKLNISSRLCGRPKESAPRTIIADPLNNQLSQRVVAEGETPVKLGPLHIPQQSPKKKRSNLTRPHLPLSG